MKIITCASYFGTGSSAITDLVSEYSSVHAMTDFEFRFVYDPDGISDLEYHIVTNHNREGSGWALKNFIKYYKFNSGSIFNKKYEKFYHGNYKKLSEQYVASLVDYQYKGFWVYDFASKGKLRYLWLAFWNKVFMKLKLEKIQILPNEITYCTHPTEEKFLAVTKDYVHQLMEGLNTDKKEFLVVDQLLPSSNINKCLRYFSDDIYVFIVNRDPRDMYITMKTAWKNDHTFPHGNAEDFVKWYLYAQNSESKDEKYDEKKVMRIQFEDLIYRYEESKSKIEALTGLNPKDHISPFTRLNPKRSVINTMQYKKHPEFAADIAYIEEHLKEYLYDFDAVKDNEIAGVEPNNKEVF